MKRRLAGLLVVAAVALGSPAAAGAATFEVGPGQSIQAALDAAPSGSVVRVAPGTYFENVEITKDNTTLLGAGAGATILRPPGQPLQRFCTPDPSDPAPAGICAIGSVDFNSSEGLPVLRRITRVTISGFTVEGFNGVGIVVVAGNGVTVHSNASRNNQGGGTIDVNSTGSRYIDNEASANGSPGIRVVKFGDPTDAAAQIIGNRAMNNRIFGINVVGAAGGTIARNVIEDNCAGIGLEPIGPVPAARWQLVGNSVRHNNRACAPGDGPPLSGGGIAIAGARDILVAQNQVLDNQPAGPSVAPGGIRVESGAPFGGPDPVNVRVMGNNVHRNLPFDMVWDGSGSGVSFQSNSCETSDPPGLCG